MASSPHRAVPSSSFTSIPSLSTYASTSTFRLQALYSDFSRQRHSNPTSYHAGVEWWRKTLELIASSGMHVQQDGDSASRLVLHADRGLSERLKINGIGKPLALGSVVTELCAANNLILLTDFLNSNASIYNTRSLPMQIASFVVGKPLWWTLEQFGIVGEEGLISGRRYHQGDTPWLGDYVVVPLVSRAADAIIEAQRMTNNGPSDGLYSLHGFRKTFAHVLDGTDDILHEVDAKVLIKFLERERRMLVVNADVIKFVASGATAQQRIISPVDRGILELKTAVVNLHRQIEGIQLRIKSCTRKAVAAVRENHKTVGLNYLRSRKQLFEHLDKCLRSLGTLESTLLTVEAAAGDVEILKMYESSTATLRNILSHSLLQRSNVEQTMGALAEANADAREIDEVVRSAGDVALSVEDIGDDDEIEAELRALTEEANTLHQTEFEKSVERLKDVRMQAPGDKPEGNAEKDKEFTNEVAVV